MIGRFKPRMDILPPAQRRLWPELRPITDHGFVLYGGTAIALRLGHRISIDFDFFSDLPLDQKAVIASLPFGDQSTVLQDEPNTLTLLVSSDKPDASNVKVSFFGAISFGRVGNPDRSEDGMVCSASLDDLMANKVKVILQRAEAKDYRDIASMIGAGVDLARGLAAARCLFGPSFQPSESLKALVYFQDGDLDTLDDGEKAALIKAASAVRRLPKVDLISKKLLN